MANFKKLLADDERMVLDRARSTYGIDKQLMVAMEELCELAIVCAKFPRYEDPGLAREELHKKAIDEVSDVLIVLDHIVNIFDLTDKEIKDRIHGKVSRVDGWLRESDSMVQTTISREVPGQTDLFDKCSTCVYNSLEAGKGASFHPCTLCQGGTDMYARDIGCSKCAHSGKWDNLKPYGICAICRGKGGVNFTPKGEDDASE